MSVPIKDQTKSILVKGFTVILMSGGVCIEKRANPEQAKLILKYLVDEGIVNTSTPFEADGGNPAF